MFTNMALEKILHNFSEIETVNQLTCESSNENTTSVWSRMERKWFNQSDSISKVAQMTAGIQSDWVQYPLRRVLFRVGCCCVALWPHLFG